MVGDVPKYPDDFGRQRGIFTERDRKFLAGLLDDELNANQKRQKRYRLRKRMFHALQDLAYLSVMSIEDLGQLTAEFESGSSPSTSDSSDADSSVSSQPFHRLSDGAYEVIGLFRELHEPEHFHRMVRRQLGKQAALDHYEETGNFGKFDVTIDVELQDELSPAELETLVEEQYHQGEPVMNEYPGAIEVLDLLGIEQPRFVRPELTVLDDIEGTAVETAIEVVEELANEDGLADEREAREEIAELEGLSMEEADAVLTEGYYHGYYYSPRDWKLKPR